MEVGSIFLILALAVLVGLFVGRPFLSPPEFGQDARRYPAGLRTSQEHHRSTLLAER